MQRKHGFTSTWECAVAYKGQKVYCNCAVFSNTFSIPSTTTTTSTTSITSTTTITTSDIHTTPIPTSTISLHGEMSSNWEIFPIPIPNSKARSIKWERIQRHWASSGFLLFYGRDTRTRSYKTNLCRKCEYFEKFYSGFFNLKYQLHLVNWATNCHQNNNYTIV